MKKKNKNKKTESITLLYKTDVPNLNGHIYSKEVMREAFKEYSPKIENNTSFGTLGQKIPIDIRQFMEINPLEASHIVKNIEEHLEGFMITANVLETPQGKILKELIDNKVEICFGLKGTGRIEHSEKDERLIKDFKVISVDVLLKDQ